jgi:hypothetical protein
VGPEVAFNKSLLAPATRPQVIVRMLLNLKRIYVHSAGGAATDLGARENAPAPGRGPQLVVTFSLAHGHGVTETAFACR